MEKIPSMTIEEMEKALELQIFIESEILPNIYDTEARNLIFYLDSGNEENFWYNHTIKPVIGIPSI